MARFQQRRSVSLNRSVYVAASKHAFRVGKTLSQLVTESLRSAGIEIPDTHHTPVEIAQLAAEAIRHSIPARDDRYYQRKRMRVGKVASAKVVESYRLIKRDGPIRRALSDAHADACGEPHWHERVRCKAAA